MEDRLRSLVVRFRESFRARRRLVLAGYVAAGVLLLFLFASNRDVRSAHSPAVPFQPERGSQTSEILPPGSIRPMGGDARLPNAPTSLPLPSELY